MTFTLKDAQDNTIIKLPCGQCIGCRLERSRQWAIRCVGESKLYQDNSFLTLTFNDESLYKRKNPTSLDKTELQKFMKRLRKYYTGKTIRYYACGEYGEKTARPHYHLALFNHDFEDKKIWKKTSNTTLYTSEILSKIWPYGYSVIGDVTFESAAYIARYIMKKVNGQNSFAAYNTIDPETGEILHTRTQEFTTMSLKPGIGAGYFERYKNDIYPSDFIIMNGKKVQPPKFYDKLYERYEPFEMEQVKEERLIKIENKPFESSQRLEEKQQLAEHRLKRDYPRQLD